MKLSAQAWSAYLLGLMTGPVYHALYERLFPEYDLLTSATFKGRYAEGWIPGTAKVRATGETLPYYHGIGAMPDGTIHARFYRNDDAVALLDPTRKPDEGWQERRLVAVTGSALLEEILRDNGVPFSREEAEEIEAQFASKRAAVESEDSDDDDSDD